MQYKQACAIRDPGYLELKTVRKRLATIVTNVCCYWCYVVRVQVYSCEIIVAVSKELNCLVIVLCALYFFFI